MRTRRWFLGALGAAVAAPVAAGAAPQVSTRCAARLQGDSAPTNQCRALSVPGTTRCASHSPGAPWQRGELLETPSHVAVVVETWPSLRLVELDRRQGGATADPSRGARPWRKAGWRFTGDLDGPHALAVLQWAVRRLHTYRWI